MTADLWLRFLSGPDIDSLGLSNADILTAVEDAVRAHGQGRVVVEPRVHLVPDNHGAGHFNVLRGHLSVPNLPGPSAAVSDLPGPSAAAAGLCGGVASATPQARTSAVR